MNKKRLLTVMGSSVSKYEFDFTTMADGALPSKLSATTWAISSGKAVNTPTATGTDIVVDGDMEAVGVTNWEASATPDTREKSTTQAVSPTQSLHIVGGNTEGAVQYLTAVLGRFYQLKSSMWNISGTSARNFWGFGFNTQLDAATAAWNSYTVSDFAEATNPRCLFLTMNSSSGEIYVDDASVIPYDTNTLIASINFKRSIVIAKAGFTLAVQGQQGGVDVCIDNPSNPLYFVRGFYSRKSGKAYLVKYVNGTATFLGSDTAAYAAGAYVEVRHPATNTFQLFYNGTQVGTDYTISDAGIISNTYHALFATAGAQAHNFFLL